jgi:ABC-type proline/glycine betaine transport system ATPase subunit
MDIIVLEGPKQCGKTTSLGMLYTRMANNSGTSHLVAPAAITNKVKYENRAVHRGFVIVNPVGSYPHKNKSQSTIASSARSIIASFVMSR